MPLWLSVFLASLTNKILLQSPPVGRLYLKQALINLFICICMHPSPSLLFELFVFLAAAIQILTQEIQMFSPVLAFAVTEVKLG